MNAITPINPITSPNARKISFNGKNFLELQSQIVATANNGTHNFGLRATFNAGKISFKPTTNLPNNSNLTNALQPFHKDVTLQGNNFETLFRQCNKNVESWVEKNREFKYIAKVLGSFHDNSETFKK